MTDDRKLYHRRGISDYAIHVLNPDGVVTHWIAGAQRIKVYASEIVGKHFPNFLHARKSCERLAGAGARADGLLVKVISTAEGRRRGKDGTDYDVTDQRGAAARLASSEDQFRALVHGVTGPALFMLARNSACAIAAAYGLGKKTSKQVNRVSWLTYLHDPSSISERAICFKLVWRRV
jgi:hypothetical protein